MATSESHLHDPTLALIATEAFQLTVEHRVPTWDDAGVRPGETTRPAVIVNSVGRRLPLRWATTQTGIWVEAGIPTTAKQDAWVMHGWGTGPGDVHVEVLDVTPGRVTVSLARASRP